MMRNFFFVVISVASLLFLSCLAPQKNGKGEAQSFFDKRKKISSYYSGTKILRLAEQVDENHPYARASEYFAKLVNEKSDGKVSIKVYCDGKLGNSRQVVEQLRFGGIALGRISFAELSEQVPSIKLFTKAVITDSATCYDNIVRNLDFLRDCFQSEKLYPLSVFYPDQRCFYTDSPKYFHSNLYGFSGVKVGCENSSVLQEILKSYGAYPVNVIAADNYESIQKSYVNVLESDFSDFLVSDDYRFAHYVMVSEYIANPKMLVMSSEVWNQLSEEERQIVMDCAQKAVEHQRYLMSRFYSANLPEVEKSKTFLNLDSR